MNPSNCRPFKTALLALSFLAFGTSSYAAPEAKIWEETITLPTYLVAPPDPNPRFYSGRTYQGAKATFYPYPVSDQMIEERADRKYKAVTLENPYIRISVLPELGGRIFTATDKTDGYDFFYRQHVIKPALIGMLGAWISGGVEWNVPHHHRASSFMPVDYTTQTNANGSVTIWVGETEWRHRMRWVIGLTLQPDRSYIEMTMKLVNRTPIPNPVLFWINPAVHANENYQVIFPPDAEWAAQHAKPEFAAWPIAHQRYGGNDYTQGVDISWWKNHTSPVSFFCFHSDEDFFGGYDHGKQAGVIHWADHHVAPGKKFFEWGNGAEGEMWTKVLSDEDGAYLELMAGAWSDNQPDYSWLQPQQTREWKHYWYPSRKLPGLKAATLDGAADLVLSNSIARVALNTTKEFTGAHARLQAGDKALMDKAIDISPANPWSAEVPVDSGVKDEQLRLSLTAADGRELVAYQPQPRKNVPMPKPVERPKSPKDYTSSDELYFTGQRIEQLWSPSFEAEPYYQEMLRRDPSDSRANTALGILRCRQWRWAEAEDCLQKGIDRATANYIRPKDVEAFFYLGVAQREQGKLTAATDAFELAAWSPAWQSTADQALAEIYCRQGRFSLAEERIDRALRFGNGSSPKALALKSMICRALGHPAAAIPGLKLAQQFDPLDPLTLHELSLANDPSAAAAKNQLTVQLRDNTQARLELAADYAAAGFWKDAAEVLKAALQHGGNSSPMLRYSLAYYTEKAGVADNPYYKEAAQLSPDLCFPHRFEEIAILNRATEINPKDGLAPYYLGCLLYDNQPRAAIPAWETAVQRNSALAPAHRNLAIAAAQVEKNPAKAVKSLETALDLMPKEPAFYANYTRLLYELDAQYEAAATPIQKRLDSLLKNRAAAGLRDDATIRLISLMTAAGQADGALEILRRHHFHNWEGSSDLHDVYVDACLRHGIDQLRASNAAGALKDFQAALGYPLNQEVGKAKGHRVAQIHYLTGLAQEALGDKAQADVSFEKSATAWEGNASDGQYFKALALRKTGKEEEASKLFGELVKQGESEVNRAQSRERGTDEVDYFAKFGEKRSERQRQAQGHYLVGLGCLGQNKIPEANAAFAKTLELNPAHLGALTWKQ